MSIEIQLLIWLCAIVTCAAVAICCAAASYEVDEQPSSARHVLHSTSPETAFDPIAFWLFPDYSGDDPFWMRPPLRPKSSITKSQSVRPAEYRIAITTDYMLTDAKIANDSFPPLPCGCPWETTITRKTHPEWCVTRCNQCEAEWEPASNDPSGRRLAQGEHVYRPYPKID